MSDHFPDFLGRRARNHLNAPVPKSNFRSQTVGYNDRLVINADNPIAVPVPATDTVPAHDPVVTVAQVLSRAVPLIPSSSFHFSALGAGVLVDIGFQDDREIGLTGQGAALYSDLDVSAAGTVPILPTLDGENMGLPFWRLAGLDTDHGTNLCLTMTIKGAVPVDGFIGWSLLVAE